MSSLGNLFGKPKNKVTEVKGIVYKYERPDCSFKYVGESKRSWKSRWGEHKPGLRSKIKSAIKDHAGSRGHNVSMDNAVILKKESTQFRKKNIP